MGRFRRRDTTDDDFAEFVAQVEPRVRQALVVTYGPADGREAAVDALSWAWEHWSEASRLEHPVAYLYRVGQSARRRFAPRELPLDALPASVVDAADVTPELTGALRELPEQQRVVALLVHGIGWSQAEVAELLDVSPSTVHEHLNRAVTRLRRALEVIDAD